MLTTSIISTWRSQTLQRVKLESDTPPCFSLAKRDARGRAGWLVACVVPKQLSHLGQPVAPGEVIQIVEDALER